MEKPKPPSMEVIRDGQDVMYIDDIMDEIPLTPEQSAQREAMWKAMSERMKNQAAPPILSMRVSEAEAAKWNPETASTRLKDWAKMHGAADPAQTRAHLSAQYHAQGVAAPWDRWFVRLWFWFLRLWKSPFATFKPELRADGLYATNIRLTWRERLRRWFAGLWRSSGGWDECEPSCPLHSDRPPIRVNAGAGHDGGSIILRGLDESGQPIEERLNLPLAGAATSERKFRTVGFMGTPFGFASDAADARDDLARATLRANRFHRRAQRAEGQLAKRATASENEAYRQIRQLEDANERRRLSMRQLRRQLAELRVYGKPQPLSSDRCGSCPHVFPGPEQDFCNAFGGELRYVGRENGSYIRLEVCRKKQPHAALTEDRAARIAKALEFHLDRNVSSADIVEIIMDVGR